jgi:hypothetical protein
MQPRLPVHEAIVRSRQATALTDRGKVETLRAKLKRLVERGWLAEEAGPGLFGLPARNGNRRGETVKPG